MMVWGQRACQVRPKSSRILKGFSNKVKDMNGGNFELVAACPIACFVFFNFLEGAIVYPVETEVNQRMEDFFGAVDLVHIAKVHSEGNLERRKKEEKKKEERKSASSRL